MTSDVAETARHSTYDYAIIHSRLPPCLSFLRFIHFLQASPLLTGLIPHFVLRPAGCLVPITMRSPTWASLLLLLPLAFSCLLLARAATPGGSNSPGGSSEGNGDISDNPFLVDPGSSNATQGHDAGLPPIHIAAPANALPLQRSWALAQPVLPDVYPNSERFFVRRWTAADVSWISPNSPSRSIPLPPYIDGPVACGCPGPTGQPMNLYGQMEIEHMWTWSATWMYDDDASATRHFIPDIWRGRGPCPRFVPDTVLHRMPTDAQILETPDGFYIAPSVRTLIDAQIQLDQEVIAALYPQAAARTRLPIVDMSVVHLAPTRTVAQERWASWVQSVLNRRGAILYDLILQHDWRWMSVGRTDLWSRLRREAYFGPCPLGAWFDRTPEQTTTIRQFISLGLPVYYRWEDSYGGMPTLADLAPREAPVDSVAMPPLSPHRRGAPRPEGVPHPDFLHRNSERSGLVAFALKDGKPVHVSDDELIMITGGDLARHSAFPRNSSAGPSRTPRSQARQPRFASRPLLARMDHPGTHDMPGLVLPGLLHRLQDASDTGSSSRSSSAVSLINRIHSPPPPENVAGDEALPPVPHAPAQEGAAWEFALNQAESSMATSYNTFVRHGLLPTHEDRVQWAINHGQAFFAGIERPSPLSSDNDAADDAHAMRVLDEMEAADAHRVPDALVITDNTPVDARYTLWEQGVRTILARPHARAALTRGGLIARIALEFGLTAAHVLQGPSAEVTRFGTRNELHVPGGRTLIDDYLTDAEIGILLGTVGPRARYSLWPSEHVFARAWWQDFDEWTAEHDDWFTERLLEIRSAHHASLNNRQWRDLLRSYNHRARRGDN